MASKLTQRLIAAGASPERAQQFTTLAAQRAIRGGMPRETGGTGSGDGVNPQPPKREEDIIPPGIRAGATAEVAFDPQITAIAQAKYPMTWRAPALDAPEVEDYIIGIHGDKVNTDLINRAYAEKAPDFLKLKTSFEQKYKDPAKINPMAYTFNDKLFAWLSNDVSLEQVKEQIAADAVTGPGSLGGLKVQEAQQLAESLWSQYNAAQEQIVTNRSEYLKNNDKYFTASLPHPKLKYGPSTNYKMGTVSIRTLPNIEPWLKQYNEYARANFPGSSAAAGIAVDKTLKKLTANKQTPFTDEVIRRQDLYKASIVQR